MSGIFALTLLVGMLLLLPCTTQHFLVPLFLSRSFLFCEVPSGVKFHIGEGKYECRTSRLNPEIS